MFIKYWKITKGDLAVLSCFVRPCFSWLPQRGAAVQFGNRYKADLRASERHGAPASQLGM
jgi:hypothetical protein